MTPKTTSEALERARKAVYGRYGADEAEINVGVICELIALAERSLSVSQEGPATAGAEPISKEEIHKAFFALPQRGDWMTNLNWFTHGVRFAEAAIADSAKPAGEPVYLVATGETHEGQETYTRHEGNPPPMCDFETLYASPIAAAPAPAPEPDAVVEPIGGGRTEAMLLRSLPEGTSLYTAAPAEPAAPLELCANILALMDVYAPEKRGTAARTQIAVSINNAIKAAFGVNPTAGSEWAIGPDGKPEDMAEPAAPVLPTEGEVIKHRLMHKVDADWIPASEFLTGLPDKTWIAKAHELPDEWRIDYVRRWTGTQIANGIAKALSAEPASAPSEGAKPQWFFHRFVDGQKMAEDVEVFNAETLEDAMQVAARICAKRQMTVLVYASPSPALQESKAVTISDDQIDYLWRKIEREDDSWEPLPHRKFARAVLALAGGKRGGE